MSSITLAPTLVRTTSVWREVALVSVGVVAIALAAQVVIPLPFTPVPLTGQTFAVLLVGGAYGASRGALTVLAYVTIGALGAGVFAEGAHGVDVLLSATGGYLVGMLLAAAIVGWAAERGWDRRLLPSVLAMLVGSVVVYAVGASWLAVSLELSPGTAFQLGVEPFLVGDLIKLALAGALLPGAWLGLARLGGRGDA
jgi:biotin transport system substrate-specific component